MSAKNTILGMLSVTLGHFVWNTNDALVKSIVSHMPLSHILLAEHICCLIFSIVWWNCKQPTNTVHWYGDSPFILNIWVRAFFQFGMTATYFWAITLVPLGDAVCILYYCPLLIVVVAYFFLNEQLPNVFVLIASSMLTIGGILLVYQPRFLVHLISNDDANIEPLNKYGVISILLCGLSWTIACILIRKAKESHVLQLEMVNSLQSIFIWVPLLSLCNRYTVHNDIIGDIFRINDWGWLSDAYSVCFMVVIGILGFSG
eukprot:54412_1